MDLFGRRKYEEQIRELERKLSELQKEKEDLEKIIEKRDEKIRKLTNAYQESCIALKAAEQKAISQVQTMPKDASITPVSEPQGTRLSPRDMERLLRKLQAFTSPDEDSFTGYIQRASDLPPNIAESVKAFRSDRGFIVLHAPQLFTLALIPPFPIKEKTIGIGSSFQLDPLREMMEIPVIIASIHAGDTFLGMALSKDGFEEQEIIESQVKEKHSKGGWSQKRFERLREEDIKNHIDSVNERLSDLIRKYGSVARFAILGGDAFLIKQVMPTISIPVVERRLERHDDKNLNKLLDEVYGFICYHVSG
ncbi:MAG: Vms1/Ankzf1 family peptidyl-tRNA hydrolase [Methanotrichaceae archaeon]